MKRFIELLARATRTEPMPDDIQWLERGAHIIKPAGADLAIGFHWYKQGPLMSSGWRVEPAVPAGDMSLAVVALNSDGDRYRTAAVVSGGKIGHRYVVTSMATRGDGQVEHQALIVTVVA